MKNVFLVTISILISQVSFAGPRVGNGGDVIVCDNGGVKTATLLDHYEAQAVRNITIDLGPANQDYTLKINRVLANLERLDHSRASLYRQWLGEFKRDAQFTNSNIVEIQDIGAMTYPKGCEFTQIAVHQTPELPGDSRYIIRQDLWNLLDNNGKAGLILHELIYRELNAQKLIDHSSSKFARYYNAIISSRAIKTMTLKEYYTLMTSLGFESMDAQGGFPFFLVMERENGVQPAAVRFFNDEEIEYGGEAAPLYFPLTYNWHGQQIQVVNGNCTLMGRWINFIMIDGKAVRDCIDTPATPFSIDLGWLKADFKVTSNIDILTIWHDTDLGAGAYDCLSLDSPAFIFSGTDNGQPFSYTTEKFKAINVIRIANQKLTYIPSDEYQIFHGTPHDTCFNRPEMSKHGGEAFDKLIAPNLQ